MAVDEVVGPSGTKCSSVPERKGLDLDADADEDVARRRHRNGPLGPSMRSARVVNAARMNPPVAFVLQTDATAPYARASFLATEMSTSSTGKMSELMRWSTTKRLPVVLETE